MRDRAEDLRLAIPGVALWVGSWLGPLTSPPATAVTVVIVGTVLLAFRRRLAPEVLVAVALVLLGLTSMGMRVAQRDAGAVHAWALDHRDVELSGVVTTDPEFSHRQSFGGSGASQVRVTLRAEEVIAGTESVAARVSVLIVGDGDGWRGVSWGDTVSLSGSLRPAPATRPIAAFVFARGSPQLEASSPAPIQVSDVMRSGLRDAVAGTRSDAQQLLPALVVGDTSATTPLLTSDLRDSGLAHLTAVSGANVAIVVGAALLLARWAGVRGYALVGVGLGVVVWFVLLARPEASVLRAAVMGSIALVAVGVAGRPQAIRTLLASVLVLLLADPWLSRSWGFALSVAATAGLVLLARRWSERLPSGWPVAVRQATAVALAAQVATLPLVVALSGQVALLSVVANLLAAPAVAPATVLGAAAAVVSPVLPQVSEVLAWCGQWPAVWIAAVAHRAATAPASTMPWPDGWGGGLLGVGFLAVTVGVWRLGVQLRWWRTRLVAALMLVTASLVGAFLWGPGRWPPTGWVLVACDIGQGDALVVNLGDGAGLVVDAGPEPDLVDRCLDRLGVDQVPLLVLTHFHADHVNGLSGVLDGRAVGSVLVSPLQEPPEQVAEVASETRDLVVVEAAASQTGQWGDASWRVLWPGEVTTSQGSAPNNASVVLLVEVSGISMLLSGDIEPEAQEELVAQGVLPRVDVLKVPHHGSKYQDETFWHAVAPRVAVVSVGADNTYGHPDPDLLASLLRAGILVGRTDQDGSIAVVVEDGWLRLVDDP